MKSAALVALLWSAAAVASPIPPAPAGEDYLLDEAGLLGPSDEARLRALQQTALESYNSPLVVVTIPRISDYGEPSIEALATRWFNEWHIGTLGLERGANQGILLLVAVEDRRARIELGADWGRSWDSHAERIMRENIVPRFKAGQYALGIIDGAQALVEMAKSGPHSQPPGDFLDRRVRPLTKYSVLDPAPFLWAMGAGLALVIIGVVTKKNWLIFVGVGLIIFAAFTWVVLALIAAAARRRGGGSGSGRGFSGGFSGGGGASGSW